MPPEKNPHNGATSSNNGGVFTKAVATGYQPMPKALRIRMRR